MRQPNRAVRLAGIELTSGTNSSTSTCNKSSALGGAESGAVVTQFAPTDPDLMALVNAWPTLPDAVWRQVVALILTG